MEIKEIGDLTSLLMGIARTLILAAGGGVGIYKVVKGRADENPRDQTEGFVFIAAAGAIIAATYAVEAIF